MRVSERGEVSLNHLVIGRRVHAQRRVILLHSTVDVESVRVCEDARVLANRFLHVSSFEVLIAGQPVLVSLSAPQRYPLGSFQILTPTPHTIRRSHITHIIMHSDPFFIHSWTQHTTSPQIYHRIRRIHSFKLSSCWSPLTASIFSATVAGRLFRGFSEASAGAGAAYE